MFDIICTDDKEASCIVKLSLLHYPQMIKQMTFLEHYKITNI